MAPERVITVYIRLLLQLSLTLACIKALSKPLLNIHGSSHVPAPRLTSTSSYWRRWLNFSTVPQGRFLNIIRPNSSFEVPLLRGTQQQRECGRTVPTSDIKTCLAAEFIGSRHCAAASSLQVSKSCADLDPTFSYISILRTHTKFVQENKMLALGVCLPHPCTSDGRRFASSGSRLNYHLTICLFLQEKFDEMLCKLDSSEFARSFELTLTLPLAWLVYNTIIRWQRSVGSPNCQVSSKPSNFQNRTLF